MSLMNAYWHKVKYSNNCKGFQTDVHKLTLNCVEDKLRSDGKTDSISSKITYLNNFDIYNFLFNFKNTKI